MSPWGSVQKVADYHLVVFFKLKFLYVLLVGGINTKLGIIIASALLTIADKRLYQATLSCLLEY